ncbi:MAG: 4-hydroxythreonine-4-phosphate dehydrogenase PdxA [Legionellales bacterium]|nr:4-hydroxythreonine-4-phosphate dehydrogenase PdxA [Legionellales bacterium]
MLIAVTAGEPAGIGPELCLKLIQQPDLPAVPVVIGDIDLLKFYRQQLAIPCTLKYYDPAQAPLHHQAGVGYVLPVKLHHPQIIPGQVTTANAAYVLNCLTVAAQKTLAGEFAAMVTNPVHKYAVHQLDTQFSGVTEWLARWCSCKQSVMMLANSQLRVALVTTHLPVREIAENITFSKITTTLHILEHDLRHRFGIAHPRIGVCGLNPHAGENGLLGREEIEIIQPALKQFPAKNVTLVGPLPADTIFLPKYLTQFDAILAMYHDQGLPIIKYSDFATGVNITLGLPIIRTSVDHGTALDLAGKNQANPQSLIAAFHMAQQLIQPNFNYTLTWNIQ